jgi:predicted nuclease of predicted toxin-antitoxin system
VRLLLDEMYPARLAEALGAAGLDAVTVSELGLGGQSDLDVFATATNDGYVVLTENVSDYARIAADHITAGHHHPGVLIALSSRFSRRPAGHRALVDAILAAAEQALEDRVANHERAVGR